MRRNDDTTTYVYLPALLVNLQVPKYPSLSEIPTHEGRRGAPKQRRNVIHREEEEREGKERKGKGTCVR